MGESLTTGVKGLLQIAILKGMVRALGETIKSPTDFVSALNARVLEIGGGEIFSFSFLTLYPVLERFSYISCGYTPLWYLPAEVDSPRRLTTDNPPLGTPLTAEMIAVDSNFAIGDTLILHTFQGESAKKHTQAIEVDEAQFLEVLMENLFLSLQKQVDTIFRKVSQKEVRALYERPVTVIGIERLA